MYFVCILCTQNCQFVPFRIRIEISHILINWFIFTSVQLIYLLSLYIMWEINCYIKFTAPFPFKKKITAPFGKTIVWYLNYFKFTKCVFDHNFILGRIAIMVPEVSLWDHFSPWPLSKQTLKLYHMDIYSHWPIKNCHVGMPCHLSIQIYDKMPNLPLHIS